MTDNTFMQAVTSVNVYPSGDINSIILQHQFITQQICTNMHLRKLVDSIYYHHRKQILQFQCFFQRQICNFALYFLILFSMVLLLSLGISVKYLFLLLSSVYPFVLLIIRYKGFTLFGVRYPTQQLRIFCMFFCVLMLFGSRFLMQIMSTKKQFVQFLYTFLLPYSSIY